MAKKKNAKKQKVIIINNMFTGGYGYNQKNLPHEMINFFKADGNDDNYYIYITPSGTINSNIKAEDIEGVLFIRNVENGMVEVLAKAEGVHDGNFYTQGIQLDKESKISCVEGNDTEAAKIEKKKYLNEINESIVYGGKSLTKIHECNESDNGILVSMKVDKICLPKKTFYLTHKPNKDKLLNDVYFLPGDDGKKEGKQIANQSMLAYYYNDDNKIAYQQLKEILEDKNNELWKSADETLQYNSEYIDNEFAGNSNFFKITRQQDNEVMFSNMFFYYFSTYPELLKYFAENILKVNLNDKCTVEREKERMDIRIIDDKNYIIIENKIKSGINGIKKKSDKKKNDDSKDSSNVRKQTKIYTYNDDGYAIQDGKYISQLSNYLEKAENSQENRKIKAYIFAPDYSVLNEKTLEKYYRGKEYQIIHYSRIKKTLENYANTDKKIPYFQDFLFALNKHTKATDDEHRLNLLYRLKCRIEDN